MLSRLVNFGQVSGPKIGIEKCNAKFSWSTVIQTNNFGEYKKMIFRWPQQFVRLLADVNGPFQP